MWRNQLKIERGLFCTGYRRNGRSERIRTSDPCVPNAVLYQAEPHSDLRRRLIATASGHRKLPIRACRLPSKCAVASPATFAYSTASRGAKAFWNAGPAGEWCNGNTPVFGTVILGSSPSSPAILSNWSLADHGNTDPTGELPEFTEQRSSMKVLFRAVSRTMRLCRR